MIDAYAVSDVRMVEGAAMSVLPDGELMARAARGLAGVVDARLRERGGRRVVALVGAGNNGGDALYAAALLAQVGHRVWALVADGAHEPGLAAARAAGVKVVGERAPEPEVEVAPASEAPAETAEPPAEAVPESGVDDGAEVEASPLAVEDASGEEAAEDAADEEAADEEAADEEPGERHTEPVVAQRDWRALLARADVVIDGITGIGGRAGLREPVRDWVAAIPDEAYVVAVDLPSGVDPAGLVGTADCVFADETVTFGAAKPCHLLPASEPACGVLTVVDIGLDFDGVTPAVQRLTHDDVGALWPVPGATSDKYSRGVVGIVAGSTAYPGAAVLCVLGALGVGTGMVRYLGPSAVGTLVHQHAPEAVTAPGRVQAWVLGSGVDPGADDVDTDGQVARIREALAGDQPCVVDAGGLDLLDGPRSAPTVITPHVGELARLVSRLDGHELTREKLMERPLAHARAAANALDAVVVLKGSTTLVVAPVLPARKPDVHEGRGAVGAPRAGRPGTDLVQPGGGADQLPAPVRAQTDAPAWLATAGAGDVLSGVIGALLAAGLDPMDAATVGVLVHGVAADRANPGGPIRALAVAHALPSTVAGLLS
ncbi:MAG TPA: NAD(P)H-hydrate dehydratase [Dermatophilaceae bacterium]|nr:NAD(P)H-hydrate dehydratase [Dermatophilaceae bacterium]